MGFRIAEIASRLGAEAAGDLEIVISGAAEPHNAGPRQIAIALSPAYAQSLLGGEAVAAILWPGADWQSMGLRAAIFAPRGRLALARLTRLLDSGPLLEPGIHPTALIDGAEIAEDVSIGAYSIIGAGARIGSGCQIAAHVTVAPGVEIGADALILPGVRIGPRVKIGARAILQPNVAIGGDGFSFVTETPAHVEIARTTLGKGALPLLEDPTWHRIHSLGGVEIGDDVEIGSGSTVDAGTIRATRIGSGTKIDNLVQVGHNVVVGRDCLLCAQAGVAGSARIGDRVVIGGKAGVADNVIVGNDVVLGGASVVLSNVPNGRVMMGYPAVRMDNHVESYKALRRLPRILRDLAARQKPVSNPDQSD